MIGWLRALLPAGRARSAQAQAHDLADKPFTRALILRAAHYQDQALGNLKSALTRVRPVQEDRTLQEFAASCACTVAYAITTDAMARSGRSAEYLPMRPVPREAAVVVAFALLVLAVLHQEIKGEGLELDFQDLGVRTATLFFFGHPDEVCATQAIEGIRTFRQLVQAHHPKGREWQEALMNTVPLYLLQWTTDNDKLRNVDSPAMFAGLLSALLKAEESSRPTTR